LKKKYSFNRFVLFSIIFFYSYLIYSQQKSIKNNTFKVVLDAGHGGLDTGNRGNSYYEKKIALSIVLRIGKILEKESNINVIYTRKNDVFVELIERANIANRSDSDLFVSVHCDSFEKNPKVFGAGTFVMGLHANQRNFQIAQKENSVIFLEDNYEQNYDGFDPNSPESVIGLTLMQETYLDQSIIAASTIQNTFVSDLKRKNRTVKQAGFVVLKYSYMPSVLIETGFLTNKKEGAYLNSSKGQIEMAKSIASAIKSYFNNIGNTFVNDLSFKENKPTNNTLNKQKSKPNEILFKVQIAASKNSIATKSYNFKGLKSVFKEKRKELYIYYYGNSHSYKKVVSLKRKARRKGYNDAFIVAFKNGKITPLNIAIQSLK
jgi:N-acetylmuramoyl-L-alanine amidase